MKGGLPLIGFMVLFLFAVLFGAAVKDPVTIRTGMAGVILCLLAFAGLVYMEWRNKP